MAMNFLIVYFSESYISVLFGMSNKITNERPTRHLKTDKALLTLQTDIYW